MSMAIKVAKSQYQGDPGLFGFLGKAVGTIGKGLVGAATGFITGGPGGAIMGAARTVLPTSKPQVFVQQKVGATTLTTGSMSGLPALPGIGLPGGIGPKGVSVVPFGQGGLYQPVSQMAPTGSTGPLVGAPAAGGVACTTRGYHLNRTGYFTKRYGFIEKGTICVKNRRRNPLNPRALSRAMARLSSAKKAASCLGRYSIRDAKPCGCKGR